MSKILSPKAWYLVGIGAVALAADGVRRVVKKRRQETRQASMTHSNDTEQLIPMIKAEALVEPKPTDGVAKLTEAKSEAQTQPVAKTPQAEKADDLTEIKGIGPTLARRLAEAGITSFAAIAEATPDYLREVTKAPAVANPDEWINQARQLA